MKQLTLPGHSIAQPDAYLINHHLQRIEKKGFKSWRARIFNAQPRWDYISYCQMYKRLPPAVIQWPKYHWSDDHHGVGRKMVEKCISKFHGEVGFDDLLKFLLFKFGHPEYKKLPANVEPKHSQWWEQTFDLEKAVCLEADFLGDSYAEFQGKFTRKRQGYFPTPVSLAQVMAEVTFAKDKVSLTDSVLDCCGGSGRLLFPASNYSLRLYYQDSDAICCRMALLNAYLFMPQIIWPLPAEIFKKNKLKRCVVNTLPQFRRSNGPEGSDSPKGRLKTGVARKLLPMPTHS